MKQIKLRDFQRTIYSIIREKPESIEVIGANGSVGVFIPVALKDCVRSQVATKPPEIIAKNEETQIDCVHASTSPNCQKCKKPAEYEGYHWEDGEEFRVQLCGMCSNALRIQRKIKI